MSAATALIVTTDVRPFTGLSYPVQFTDRLAQAMVWCAQTDFRAIFCKATRLADGGNGFRLGLKLRQQGIQSPLYLMASGRGQDEADVPHDSGTTNIIASTREAVEKVCSLLWRQASMNSSASATQSLALPSVVPVDRTRCIERARQAMTRHLGAGSTTLIDEVVNRLAPTAGASEVASALAREPGLRIGDARIRAALIHDLELDGLIEGAGVLMKSFLGPVASMALDDVCRELQAQHPLGIPRLALSDALAQLLETSEQRQLLRLQLLGTAAPA